MRGRAMKISHAQINGRYQAALKQARKVGAARAQGDAYLANTVSVVVLLRAPGVNPAILFDAK